MLCSFFLWHVQSLLLFYPPTPISEQVKAVAILSDNQIDARLSDSSELENIFAEIIYSDAARTKESISSLLSDETVLNTAGIKQIILEKDLAKTPVELYVYDTTLTELQDTMTEMVASGEGDGLQSFLDGKYVLVDEESLSKGPLTAIDTVVSYPAFHNTYFRGPACMDVYSFTGGQKSWSNMADIPSDKITFDNLNIELTALAGSEGESIINGIYVTGEDARIINSSFSNGITDDNKTFFGVYIETDAGKTVVSDVSLTGFDSALAVKSGAVDIKNVTFDGVIAFFIDDVDDFDSLSLTGCTTLNDRSEVYHDVIVVGKNDVVGTSVEKANIWFETMKANNPGLVFGSATSLELGGFEIKDWTTVDGGEVEVGM